MSAAAVASAGDHRKDGNQRALSTGGGVTKEKSMSVRGKGNSILCLVPLGKRAVKEKGIGLSCLGS